MESVLLLTNALGKAVHPSLLPPGRKRVSLTGFFSLGNVISLKGKLNSNHHYSS